MILDVSNVAIGDTAGPVASLRRVLAVMSAYQQIVDASASFYWVADASLRGWLDQSGNERLTAQQRAGRGLIVSYADPVICELALAHGAAIVSNDRFRGLRHEFPFLQGFDRIFRFDVDAAGSARIERARLDPLPPADVSRHAEEEAFTPLGLHDRAGRRMLLREWSCRNPRCPLSVTHALGEYPRNRLGTAVCPSCSVQLADAGPAAATAELKISIAGNEVERLPLLANRSIVFGRGAGPGRFNLGSLVTDSTATRISRNHVEIRHAGSIRVRDLQSRNGTLVRAAQAEEPRLLSPHREVVLNESSVVDLPCQVSIARSGKRHPRGAGGDREQSPTASYISAGVGEHATIVDEGIESESESRPEPGP